MTLDTTNKSPKESLDELLIKTEPLVTDGEMAMRAISVPKNDFKVYYEDGIRNTKED